MPRLVGTLLGLVLVTGCHSNDGALVPADAPVQAGLGATSPPRAEEPAPSEVDLRPKLTSLGLTPRPQGARGTCSIFTTCEAIEFAWAEHNGRPARLSPEFVNWAAWQASGGASDGNFFHNAVAGFEKYGVCAESEMPYQSGFDAQRKPSAEALAQAAWLRDGCRDTVVVRWIVPWKPNRFGVDDEQFAQIKHVLASGYPVAAGSGHSRLLVGFRDGSASPGGGVFLTEDSALNRFDQVSYEFVRTQVADVFWVEALPREK
jgi:hypothetical protein